MINVNMEEVVKSKEIINPEMFMVGDLLRFDKIVAKEETNTEEVIEEGEGIGENVNEDVNENVNKEENEKVEVEETEVISDYGIVTSIAEEFIVCSKPSHLTSVGLNSGILSVNYSKEELLGFSNIAILNR